MHGSSYDLMRNFIAEHLSDRAALSVADVGSYNVNGSYRPLFKRDDWTYTGFDLTEGPNVDHLLDCERDVPIEFRGQFDVVISGQTMEHTRRPWLWMRGVAHLANAGGLVFVIAPNTFAFHEYPIDCWRVWGDGMRAAMEDAGLTVLKAAHVGVDTYGLGVKPIC